MGKKIAKIFDIKDLFFVAGVGALCYGFYQVYPPLAWIAGGFAGVMLALIASWRNADHGNAR